MAAPSAADVIRRLGELLAGEGYELQQRPDGSTLATVLAEAIPEAAAR